MPIKTPRKSKQPVLVIIPKPRVADVSTNVIAQDSNEFDNQMPVATEISGASVRETIVAEQPVITVEPEIIAEPEPVVEPEITVESDVIIEPESVVEPEIVAEPENTIQTNIEKEPNESVDPKIIDAQAKERQAAYDRYVSIPDNSIFRADTKVPPHSNRFLLQSAFFINAAWFMSGLFSGDFFQYMRDTYNPFSNGYTKTVKTYVSNTPDGKQGYIYDASTKGKFAPTKSWIINASAFFVALCIAIGIEARHNKAKRAYRKEYAEFQEDIKQSRRRANDEKATVDFMLTLKKLGFNYLIDPNSAKKLVSYVISGMSEDQSVYYHTLMSGGEISPELRDVATAIIRGHFKSNQQALDEVGDVIAKFGESIVPDELLKRYRKSQESER